MSEVERLREALEDIAGHPNRLIAYARHADGDAHQRRLLLRGYVTRWKGLSEYRGAVIYWMHHRATAALAPTTDSDGGDDGS